jgi:hypothetical protein
MYHASHGSPVSVRELCEGSSGRHLTQINHWELLCLIISLKIGVFCVGHAPGREASQSIIFSVKSKQFNARHTSQVFSETIGIIGVIIYHKYIGVLYRDSTTYMWCRVPYITYIPQHSESVACDS